MRTRRAAILLMSLTGVFYASGARANPEPPPAFDARSVGMGSTGVAHGHNGAALYHNPAAMQGIKQGAITGAFGLYLPQFSAPLDPNKENKESVGERAIDPVFLVGGAYRLGEKFTIGVAAHSMTGLDARYSKDVAPGGQEWSAKLGTLEIAPGLAFALGEGFTIGLAYRITQMSYDAKSSIQSGSRMLPMELAVSGWNFAGIHVGFWGRLSDSTRWGFSYRNKVTVAMSGETKGGGQTLDTDLEFSSPHTFKLGLAQSLFDEHFVIAVDLKYALYQDSSDKMVVKVEDQPSTKTSLDWENVMGANGGIEIRIGQSGPSLRAGYSIATSATPAKRASPLVPPPGLQQAAHGGLGFSVSQLDIDLGGYYLFAGEDAKPRGGVPGTYSMDAILGTLSATYRLD